MQIIKQVKSKEDITKCFEIFLELRPHLPDIKTFISQVRRQMQQGYQMLGVWDNDILLGVAGYRFLESFIHGQFIYVDDLVVSEKTRGKGVGGRMLHYIIREASLMRFNKVVLDTALHNSLAQRFYFKQEMLATGLHFTITL